MRLLEEYAYISDKGISQFNIIKSKGGTEFRIIFPSEEPIDLKEVNRSE